MKFNELARAKLNGTKSIVISEIEDNGCFTVAQEMEIDSNEDADKKIKIFLKGAFHIKDLAEMHTFRDAINAAIYSIEKTLEDAEEWDQ